MGAGGNGDAAAMGAGGNGDAAAGVGGQAIANADPLVLWGCRPCKILPDLYLLSYIRGHERRDREREEREREARDREAQQRREDEAAAAKKRSKWIDRRKKR